MFYVEESPESDFRRFVIDTMFDISRNLEIIGEKFSSGIGSTHV